MTVSEVFLVRLELKRIQTYLFDVPRLPVMVGANALMGETLRGCWGGDGFDPEVKGLPRLAEEHARWNDNVATTLETSFQLAAEEIGDNELFSKEEVYQDAVAAVAEKTGVLTRDGGHFEALFPSVNAAYTFLERADNLLLEKLPGVLLQKKVYRLVRANGVWNESELENDTEKKTASLRENRGIDLLDFPQGEVCHYSGQEPASSSIKEGKTVVKMGKTVAEKYYRGRDFDRQKTSDVLGILRPGLVEQLGYRGNPEEAFPSDFSHLATNGYMAILHVDGNSVGKRFKQHMQQTSEKDDFFLRWRKKEEFFYQMRSGFRVAVMEAIVRVFKEKLTRQKKIPLRLLMLGGDDLVLVCGAMYALPFVVELAQCVQRTTKNLPAETLGEKAPLTVGAGAAIVQSNFPFYRAHDLAEQLASSAKRLKSSLPLEDGNVVDWIVTTEAWHGEIEDTRRRTFLRDDQLILSNRPYPVLPVSEKKSPQKSLKELHEDAKELAVLIQKGKIARSQLRRLAEALPEGQHTAHFVAKLLPETLRVELRNREYLNKADDSPWISLENNRHLSRILDLMELVELQLL